MVAKIGRGQSLFGALTYNLKKVEQRQARVIDAHRVVVGDRNPMQKMLFSFESYLAANRRTEKPIVHISLNPSPRDTLTDGQLAALAADYLDKMGYGDQPRVVFLHEDTGRRHVHIVTTCVDERGRKISDRYEWRRSMTACRELEQKYSLATHAARLKEARLRKVDPALGDLKRQVAGTLKGALSTYKFQSFGEFAALLSCFNVEAKLVRGEHNGVPYTGIVYTPTDSQGRAIAPPFKSSLFGKQFGHEALSKRRSMASKPQFGDTVRLAMHTCMGSRERFQDTLHAKGIDVVFRQSDNGRIYGATFIDHRSRQVCNGSRLDRDLSANALQRLFTEAVPSHHHIDLPGIDLWSPDAPIDDFIPKPKKKKKRKIN